MMFCRVFLMFCVCSSQTFAADQNLSLRTRDGTVLSGIVHTPGVQPIAIALLLPGSGNVGLDGDVSSPFVGMGYQGQRAALSEQLVQSLSEVGVATYRYAKRGFENPAELAHQTFPYLLNDAEDAAAMIAQQFAEIPLLLVGFSEGALIAVHLAARTDVSALFLLGLPSRPIDAHLDYQFVEWPLRLLRNRADLNQDGMLDVSDSAALSTLPLTSTAPSVADANGDGFLSLSTEAAPFYQNFYVSLRGLLSTPLLADWYNAMVEVPLFTSIAPLVSERVYVYHGALDPQVNPYTTLSDSRYFQNMASFRIFEGVGHAFAPLDGAIGEVKTSGPFSTELLEQLATDVRSLL